MAGQPRQASQVLGPSPGPSSLLVRRSHWPIVRLACPCRLAACLLNLLGLFFFFGVTGPPGLGDVELHRAVAHSKFARHLATRCCRCVMYKGRESSAAFFVHSTDTFDPRTFPTCICNRLRGTLISDCQRTHTTTVVYLSSPDITHPPLLAKHAPHRAHPCSMLRRSSDSQLPLSLCRPQERLHGGL